MYNRLIMHSLNYLPFFCRLYNYMQHVHIIHEALVIFINRVTVFDQCNFIYHCILNLSNRPLPYRQLHKKAFINNI